MTRHFSEGSKHAVAGVLLAITNTASEFGYGSIIAVLPGFLALSALMRHAIPNALNEAISVQTLAGIVGSASGGLSIALGAMSDIYINAAQSAGIPLQVAHRIASMASGGMDSLPHNGAVITMLAVTGLTHRQAYKGFLPAQSSRASRHLWSLRFITCSHIVNSQCKSSSQRKVLVLTATELCAGCCSAIASDIR